jgi:hypothetical protein
MGTRCVTVVRDEEGRTILRMYRQMDGYVLGGHGEDLRKLLKNMIVVNGLSAGQPKKVANGMGCLAAQVVAHFKGTTYGGEPGGIYLIAPGADWGPEYVYEVRFRALGKPPRVTVKYAYGDDEKRRPLVNVLNEERRERRKEKN